MRINCLGPQSLLYQLFFLDFWPLVVTICVSQTFAIGTKYLREPVQGREDYFGSQFGVFQSVLQGRVVEQSSHKRRERRKGAGIRYSSHRLLPSAVPHHLKFPEPPKTALPLGTKLSMTSLLGDISYSNCDTTSWM
jgi:hypothetical protein